ncbi:MAG: urea carboxylase-associated protein [Citromicrobium sp.]|nr:urea carboxylase-associated protein [Citromicrobium sp.]MAO97072.1 urea carboxylase-associated protein [Citromicrobium sp.]MAS84737.1 urea carboxylase-associated protein [Erythrobacteraceae bacterium]|tara:strand:+ start:1542 stop:2150 length:609 start_codon:yes stop_codon:yes gene_type:complete
MSQTIEIPPRSGAAFVVKKGEAFTVIDPQGSQVSDMIAFVRDDVREVMSNGRTFDYEETIRLTKGNRLWSNRSNVMLTIEDDSLGQHDYLLTPCSEDTFRHFYPDKPVHRGCMGNLEAALAPYGIERDAIPTAFNVFMNVPVDGGSGSLSVDPPTSKPGEAVRFRAHMDLVIGLTACSAYASNGGSFRPIHYRIEAEAAADD